MILRDGKLFVLLVCSCALLCGCAAPSFVSQGPSDRFALFVEEYFSDQYSLLPKPDSLNPFPPLLERADSLEGVAATRALAVLHAIDTSRLSVDERIDWIQLEGALKREIRDSSRKDAKKRPSQYLTVSGLYWQLLGDRSLTSVEWAEVLSTLRHASIATEIGRRQLESPPPLWISLAANTARRYEEFLSGVLVEKIQSLAPDSMRNELLRAGKEARQAISSFRVFLTDTLLPGREDSWMAGAEYYDWLLHEVHFLPYTAESMIGAGWRVHRETKLALEELARSTHPSKTWRQMAEEMKERHPAPGTIARAYRKESDRVRRLLVDKHLISIPLPETLLFVPTPPALRETYAWGGYGGIVTRDSIASGRFFVTDIVPEMTPKEAEEKMRAQNNGWITVIALHEGYPGHHLQSLYERRNASKVRSQLGSTYYGEGWALFCEAWMAREGFYENADDSLAWLQMRLWRTARVIVDPSLHTGRMTYEQAIRFMVEEVGLEPSAAEAEVNRYTTWPTQAPSYIIGWLEIEDLRKELQSRLGQRFLERDFVEAVLNAGSLPLQLMKRSVRIRFGL